MESETLLVGDVKLADADVPAAKAVEVLKELRLLMERHRIEKIDVAWSHFNNPIFRMPKGLA